MRCHSQPSYLEAGSSDPKSCDHYNPIIDSDAAGSIWFYSSTRYILFAKFCSTHFGVHFVVEVRSEHTPNAGITSVFLDIPKPDSYNNPISRDDSKYCIERNPKVRHDPTLRTAYNPTGTMRPPNPCFGRDPKARYHPDRALHLTRPFTGGTSEYEKRSRPENSEAP